MKKDYAIVVSIACLTFLFNF
ncbi:MAG: hypothetical protein RL757_324, partial [Bacteroidota bacterium]